MNMITIVNLISLAILIVFMISGYKRGFVLKVIGILSFFLVGFLAWQLSSYISQYILIYPKDSIPLMGTIVEDMVYGTMNRITIFVLLFVVLQILVVVLRKALHIVHHIPVVSTLNRFLGCLFGSIEGFFVLFLVALVLQLPFIEHGNQIVSKSYLRYYEPIAKVALFYIKEPITQIQQLTKGLGDKQSISSEDVNKLQQWLLEQDISKENVDEVVSHLRVE